MSNAFPRPLLCRTQCIHLAGNNISNIWCNVAIKAVDKMKPIENIFIIQHLRYYAEVENEWRGPSTQLSAWALGNTASKKRRSGDEPQATVSDLTGPAIEPMTLMRIAMCLITT